MIWPVYSLLSGASAVTALVGTRIWEDGVPEQYGAPEKPYIVWGTAGGQANNYLSENPGIDNPRISIDCYGSSKGSAHNVAIAVRNALQGSAHQVGQPFSSYEPDTKLYRIILDFSFWVVRP